MQRFIRNARSPVACALAISLFACAEFWPRGAAAQVFNLFPASSGGDFPVAGPDGALWFTEFNGNKIGRITTAGFVSEFTIPTANAGPGEITVGPDGAQRLADECRYHRIGSGDRLAAAIYLDPPDCQL